MKAYQPKPCKRCGQKKEPRTGGVNMWYCAACAAAVRAEWQAKRNPCGVAHEWYPVCKICEGLKKINQLESARRSAITRSKRRNEYVRGDAWTHYWAGKAHCMVKSAIKQGILPSLDGTVACFDCGESAHEYDHRDYGRPLDVQPVCRRCNKQRGAGVWPSREQFQFALVSTPPQKAAA